jgi:hypothetical protein
MKKIIYSLFLFLFFANFAYSQDLSAAKKAEDQLIEIKKIIQVEKGSYDYINQLLIYYFDNNNADSKQKSKIKENIHNKLKAKLSEEDYSKLNEMWLKKNLN